jgi:diguanylate cyclase (GGDEF)-like protein
MTAMKLAHLQQTMDSSSHVRMGMELNGEGLGAAPEWRAFAKQVLFPFVGLIAVTLLALLALVLWSAGEANRLASTASHDLAQTGFQLSLQQVGSNVTATATWDDAVVHLHDQHQEDWAVENVGNWATDTLHFEMTFVVDPEGLTRFGMVDGKVTHSPIQSVLGDGLQSFLDRVRAAPSGDAATGIVLAGDQVALVGAAAIRPHTDKLPPITGGYSILVYADLLDPAAVKNLQEAYLLRGLMLVHDRPNDAHLSLPLMPAQGPPVAYLTWTPDLPGVRMLAVILPVLAALALAIGVLAAFIVLHARAATAISRNRQLALTDSLTGLPNRVLLGDRLQQAIRGLDRNHCIVAILCLDLDGFKSVNDAHGHAAGDALLREVAERLRKVLRSADIVARTGGDEFVVVQTAPTQRAVELLAERLLIALSEPMTLSGTCIDLGASIGISISRNPLEVGSDLLRQADLALYDAKRAGRGTYRIADPSGAVSLDDRRPDQLGPEFAATS